MTARALALVLLTASGAAGAQTDSEVGRAADSLFAAVLDANRAALVGHTSLAASGPEGTLYYRIDAEGNARCRLAPRNLALTELGEIFCLSMATADEWMADDVPEADDGPMKVEMRSDVWEGAPVHVVTLRDLDDAFDTMEMWIGDGSPVLRRIWMSGRLGGSPDTVEMELRYDDVRTEAGVPFPRRIRFRFPEVRAMLGETIEAWEATGQSLHELYAQAQARHKANPSAESAVGLGMLKAAITGTPFEIGFPIEEVRLDGPVPEGLFDDEAGGARSGR